MNKTKATHKCKSLSIYILIPIYYGISLPQFFEVDEGLLLRAFEA
jgi:hypothetical protein